MPVEIYRGTQVPSGMWWDDKGILFSQWGTGILRVSPSGGKPSVVVAIDAATGRADSPQVLPDGRTLLYTLIDQSGLEDSRWDTARIVVQSLAGGERKTLVEGGSDARYVPTGHIVYALQGTLFAVPFDLATLTVTGDPVPVIEGVRRATASVSGTAHYAFSNSGALVYMPGPTSEQEASFSTMARAAPRR